MMICDADFDELFSPMDETVRRAVPAAGLLSPTTACIARWEDDGGRTLARQDRGTPATVRTGRSISRSPDPTTAGLALTMMPAAAAYDAAWSVLAAYGRMTQA